MSIFVTSLVWKFSKSEGSTLLVALAIADFADDEGRAYPAVSTLAAKARVSERTTQYALAQLVDLNELRIERGTGPRGCNTYAVQVQNLRGANSAGVQNTAEGGATHCTQTVIEPPKKKKEKDAARDPIRFDAKTGDFVGITDDDLAMWAKAYPLVDARGEITRASCWLISNPTRQKQQLRRFITNWLSKANRDRENGTAPRIASPRAPSPAQDKNAHRDAFSAHLWGNTQQPQKGSDDDGIVDVVATQVE
ncbi:hypothetical protein DEH84_06890 [Aquabacterium olei]|uniref:Helix-turn-helix domain-containing protein n=1 Tax=Aquabacterium olei TaxID=1296669 RepID=A0A2U8FQ63_9BURK|nr:helix-turn-helix domain-containing protein [Aquabacterium olei]AWI53185.1 hypothetical protein DEH84_06890 [Aquabacterium olei]